jgi:CRISPR-associated endoribonuclease Cas6
MRGPAGAAIPLTAPLAVVSSWLDGDRGAHKAQGRPWALTPPRNRLDGVTVLGVRLLDDALEARLGEATAPGTRVRLGSNHITVAAPVRRTSTASWQELAQPTGERAWQFRVVTPAAIRRGNRTSPWLAPESVAHGLLDRWRILHPATAPALPERGFSPIWVSDIDGHSETAMLREQVVSGFVGRLRYVADEGPDARPAVAAFDALMAFAAYAGIGSHTTAGFGVIVPERTWPR